MVDWADERAKEIADAVCDNWEVQLHSMNWSMCKQAASTALRQARLDALEEAAKACEALPAEHKEVKFCTGPFFAGDLITIKPTGRSNCAAAIRSLKEKQP